MKRIVPVIFLFLLSFILGCNKPNSSTSIQGAWELRHVEGGYRAPGANPDFPPGNGNIVIFTANTYKYYSNGQLSSSGSFSITREFAAATGKKMDAIINDGNMDDKQFFEINHDSLKIYRGIIAADGIIATYARIDSIR